MADTAIGTALNDYAWKLVKDSSTLSADVVTAYLRGIGYHLSDEGAWCESASWPRLEIFVKNHSEWGGHTYYLLRCQLWRPGGHTAAMVWKGQRRLCHIRAGIYSAVKQDLSRESYERCFGESRFAHRFGPPGTTGRLRAWFQALTRDGLCGYDAGVQLPMLSPVAAARVLKVLGAPDLSSSSGAAPVGGQRGAPAAAFAGGSVGQGMAGLLAADDRPSAPDCTGSGLGGMLPEAHDPVIRLATDEEVRAALVVDSDSDEAIEEIDCDPSGPLTDSDDADGVAAD
eukprot:TRINITY_DN94350_c0_g1_i1.p1 TRINITY_DN94350_c0_g1~~TRINITY_DN94350_c0_g1_i1.p1  ORF type:complete len:285 (+),score=54.65 TRINITY_DN94350_c0_g1_i1:149-1003(+)